MTRKIQAHALSARDIAYIGHDIAEALEYLHHHDVVHRDIKPANILLADFRGGGTRPRAKLTDFGISLPADIVGSRFDTTTGTAAYMSPEQAEMRAVGPASDVYSLGLVLLECFTRQYAFPGDETTSITSRLVRDPIIPADVPEEWRILLRGMTARDPADRPTSKDAMVTLRDLVITSLGRRRDTLSRRRPEAVEGSRPSGEGDDLEAYTWVPDTRIVDGGGEVLARVQFVEETRTHVTIRIRFRNEDVLADLAQAPVLTTRAGTMMPWTATTAGTGTLTTVAEMVFAKRRGYETGIDTLLLISADGEYAVELNASAG